MDIKSLATFIQVAESNSFSKAADILGYSQPTISFQIKQLESELSVQLFDRIGHTICLTENGKRLLSYAQKICRLAEDMAMENAESDVFSGEVRLAMASSLCTPLVLEKFAKFHTEYPHISLKITTAGTDDLFSMLDHNEADIVCTLDNHIYNNSYVICNEEQVGVHFVCSNTHPLAKSTSLSLGDLIAEDFLLTEKGMSYRRLMDEAFAKISTEISPILEFGDADIICNLVSEGAGISFLPDYVTKNAVNEGKITLLDINDCNFDLWKQIIYHKSKWMSAPITAVLDYISNTKI